jgi:hypothetical protein
MPFNTAHRMEPFDIDGPDEIDDLRADNADLQDALLGLEHDLDRVAEVIRAFGITVWGGVATASGESDNGVELTEDQAAVLDRLSML